MAAGVAAGEDGCESAGCCAALNEASKQVVNIQFQVRMTLFSKVSVPSLLILQCRQTNS